MPPLRGPAAKKFWIEYTSSMVNGLGAPVIYKMQMNRRHIHWLNAIGPTGVVVAPTQERGSIQSTRLKPRLLHLSNGVKRVSVRYPAMNNAIWKDLLADLDGLTFTLEGEAGSFKIVGRTGEHESKGVSDYDGS